MALALLLATPLAWGCDSSAMAGCDMGDCPISDGHGSSSWDQNGDGPSGCDGQVAVSLDCCDEPADRPLAEETTAQSSGQRLELPTAEIAQLRSEPPPPLPVDAACVICSQEHSLGRFTILSTYLL